MIMNLFDMMAGVEFPMLLLDIRCVANGRDEHFIGSIVFQNKHPIYHCFFSSVRKMSECFSQ